MVDALFALGISKAQESDTYRRLEEVAEKWADGDLCLPDCMGFASK